MTPPKETSSPANPQRGQLFRDTTTGLLWEFDGNQWNMVPELVPLNAESDAALELIETAYLASTDEPDISDQWEDWPLEYKCDVRSWLDSVAAAVRKVKAQLDENIADELGENNAIRIGDRVYRAQQGGTWKVTEDAANDGSLAAWMGEDWRHIVNLKAPGAVTKSRLEAWAKERAEQIAHYNKQADASIPGANAKEAAQKVVKDFMVREPSGGPLTVMPHDRAPKFLQKLDHGDTLYPVGKKELGS